MAHLRKSDILLLLLLSLHIIIAQENESSIIQPASSLYAGKHPSSWPSSSGYFRFGFYPQGNGYSVGIWLVGRSENTTVWTANRDDPPVSSNATLEFTTQGRLLLRTEDGMEKIIANLTMSVSVDAASMSDTGNFMLYQNRTVVWESFNFPTDTILGGQNLSGSHNMLISSVSRSNHSSGPYLLRMQDDGNLVAYANNPAELDPSDAYWATMTNGWYFSVLNLNERGVLAMYSSPKFHQEKVLANLSATGNETMIIYRATLDPDGNFRLYSHQLERNTISHKWQILNDECDAKGQCGLNSYCSSRGKDTECYCYPGFTFIDENTKSLGCSQNFTIDGCVARKDLVIHYNITTLDNMSWAGDPYSVKPNLEKEDCKKACQEDCSCGGVLYSDTKSCRMYRLPLKYGKRHGNITTTAFIKFILGSTISPPPETSQILISEGNQSLVLTMGETKASF
ncbi:G-type lectin S-receptor-like serine/threonine-protein kinase LECRK1 isoform X1 [Gossypium hirsutum]|uniref:G-type lectin S-receptor-like serine/threonine-protein kinase LECRK1 isoform X1 n=1 Tax=Gossypium hirsutum TaxID=3635 RepID=A0ABM2ZYF8_GOSHI|nr:G-type lectin S-receptor-like serine/threonine-protein kinase LECRK1 isoform X1 [Gossypium hirsutum]